MPHCNRRCWRYENQYYIFLALLSVFREPNMYQMKTTLNKLFLLLIMATTFNNTFAQSCTGEVVKFKEDFGSGKNATELPTGRTNYSYNSGSALSDGDYQLNKSSQGRPEWHNSGDHTGNKSGRMMVVNASYAAGEFYRDTVTGLTANSFYSVYLYVMNINTLGTCGSGAILPRLQFVVESFNNDGSFTQLTSFSTANIAQTQQPTWVLVGGSFILPQTTTAIRYRIINNAPGGCGNDLAIDDITFAQCPNQALPVTGMKLQARTNGENVDLSWTTLQEINTDRFILEKSMDGKIWEAITSLTAAGNSNSLRRYAVSDPASTASITYYRILQTDIDGRFSYSNQVTVNGVAANTELAAYPNPFTNKVALSISADRQKTARLRMLDINGREVKVLLLQLQRGENKINLEQLETLHKGIYIIDIREADGTKITATRVVKH